MKKRQIRRKLSLRKDTLQTLGQDAMGKVVGGYQRETRTEDEFCIATTLAQGCAHATFDCPNPTDDCTGPTYDGTASCDITLCTCF